MECAQAPLTFSAPRRSSFVHEHTTIRVLPNICARATGDGIRQGRAHARGASTPGATAQQQPKYAIWADHLECAQPRFGPGTNLAWAHSKVGVRPSASGWSAPNRGLLGPQTSLGRTPTLECAQASLMESLIRFLWDTLGLSSVIVLEAHDN